MQKGLDHGLRPGVKKSSMQKAHQRQHGAAWAKRAPDGPATGKSFQFLETLGRKYRRQAAKPNQAHLAGTIPARAARADSTGWKPEGCRCGEPGSCLQNPYLALTAARAKPFSQYTP